MVTVEGAGDRWPKFATGGNEKHCERAGFCVHVEATLHLLLIKERLCQLVSRLKKVGDAQAALLKDGYVFLCFTAKQLSLIHISEPTRPY